jgi:oligopeptide/dipeptide ABC transporter ATP-binding protein
MASLTGEELRQKRWKEFAFIPQNAMGSLDSVYTIQEQLVETVRAHEPMSKREAVEQAKEVLRLVDIDVARIKDYPHEMSGGMKQRILLAMSLLLKPDLIIADEPTTGLDVLVRDRILNDLERYRDEFGVSLVIISHDITSMFETCDQLLLMYGGKIVERGPAQALFGNPTHPYTIALLNSVPRVGERVSDLTAMGMDPPDLVSPPPGCRFVERCPVAKGVCYESHPEFFATKHGTRSACYRADEADQLEASIKGAKTTNG